MSGGFAFLPSGFNPGAPLWSDYVGGISIPYDDYLENHILDSSIFEIRQGSDAIGLVGVRGRLITLFHLPPRFQHEASRAFELARERFCLEEAFVPTTDLGFLAAALEVQRSVEIQACHFEETGWEVPPPAFSRDRLRIARAKDLPAIKDMAGDFLDNWEGRIGREELLLYEPDGGLAGLGVLVPNRIMPGCVGTGMFTHAPCRGKGVGRSIILHLRDLSHERGLRPVPGCWYHNTASRKTLESAGYTCRSRLLRIHF